MGTFKTQGKQKGKLPGGIGARDFPQAGSNLYKKTLTRYPKRALK
jgi:hypothetical protein